MMKRKEISSDQSDVDPDEVVAVAGDDRLSSLPDDLICRILSFLPTREAALTSQLSRRWRRVFGRLAELSLSSCCPRLRLRAVRRLALHTLDHLEVLDINGVDDLEALDVSAPKPPVPEPERPLLLPPSPRRVSRPPAGTAATRSISPFRSGLARVRRLDGPLKLAVVRRRDQFDRRPLHHAAPCRPALSPSAISPWSS
ncbi:hypothetical protein OsJ_36802 [Oryza sativa Japonica Group]|uniref:F-box domain-containing protein n=1 Tax=Oryza sativa subsp. japonica TaxID=39947 RepID=B9GE64_ORYSJ|nr:hypothetical protein OsJ_36802 [Oryza sativa Japonica Group]